MTRRGSAAALLVALLVTSTVALAGPASSSTGAAVSSADPNASCINAALSSGADSWTCFGDVLTTTETDAAGKDVVRTRAVPGATLSSAEDTRSHSGAATPIGERASFGVALAAADDYDTWCENGTVCGREIIDKYIAEVKGNGAYGDSDGVIGRVDVVQRQSFNGRWPRWRGLLIWDSGPAITTTGYRVTCRINRTGPDGYCGLAEHDFETISSKHRQAWSPSTTGYVRNSERLVGSTKYHDDATGSFRVSGSSLVFRYGTLHTGRWRYCSKRCQYYQVPWRS